MEQLLLRLWESGRADTCRAGVRMSLDEALTSERRSGCQGDLLAVSTDLESYFLFLKAACDVLAELAVELAFEPRRRGQAPSGSFHDLADCAARQTAYWTVTG
jgi:hypothetical protein